MSYDENINPVLITMLPKEEQDEDEQIFTIGESIASQFYYGNWNYAVEEMKTYNVTAKEFYLYLEAMAEKIEGTLSDLYRGHFDTMFFMELQKEV